MRHPLQNAHLTNVSRRGVLLGAAGTVILAACGSDDSDSSEEPGEVELTLDEDSVVLRTLFNPGAFYLQPDTEQRLTFALTDFQGAPLDEYPEAVDFQLYYEGEGAENLHEAVGDPITAQLHDDGIPRPYYPLRFTPNAAGIWSAETQYDTPAKFQVDESVDLVQIGGEMVSVPTATFDDHLDMDTICTLTPEPCPFHTESLETVLGEGRQVAFLISTPQFCQTGICGPVLELLMDAQEANPDLAFIHSEVYTNATEDGDPTQWTAAPPVAAYGLSFEPSLFIGDADGMVVDRLDNIYDAAELNESLAKAQ